MAPEHISWDDLRDGIHLAMKYAESFLNTSKKLHDDGEYQISIPYAILAFEESSKADHLDKNRLDGLGISNEEWRLICNHEYKLTDAEKQSKENLENQTDADIEFQGSIMDEIGLQGIHDRKTAIQIKEKQIEIYSRFSIVKERCFYANWNKRKNKWESLNDLTTEEKKSLSLFILHFAESKYLLAKFRMESHEIAIGKSFDNAISSKQLNETFQEKIKRHRGLKSVREMNDFVKKMEESSDELLKGNNVFDKYFSN